MSHTYCIVLLYNCTIHCSSLHELWLKLAGETPGLFCVNGTVKLPLLPPEPEPKHIFLCGATPQSPYYLASTQNRPWLSANITEEHEFNPTFKEMCVKERKCLLKK